MGTECVKADYDTADVEITCAKSKRQNEKASLLSHH